MRNSDVYFTESQRFTQWWLWLLLLGINGLLIYAVIYQVIGGQPWGNNPMSDTGLLVLLGLVMVASGSALFFRLDTRIEKAGVFVRFVPFHPTFRYFPWESLSKCYVRKYAPILEYGGWGWRFSITGKGKAYNVSGNRGLQLEFSTGKKLLIGTNRPEELTEALEKAGKIKAP